MYEFTFHRKLGKKRSKFTDRSIARLNTVKKKKFNPQKSERKGRMRTGLNACLGQKFSQKVQPFILKRQAIHMDNWTKKSTQINL